MFPRRSALLFIGTFFCLTLSRNAPAQGDARSQVASGYDGVDILIIRDDSGSMDMSRRILATELFTLVSALVDPPADSPYSPVEDIRVGVVSSDMGLQWAGNPGPSEQEDGGVPLCTPLGNDGVLLPSTLGSIHLLPDEIPCSIEDPNCPIDWQCVAGAGGQNGLCNPVPPTEDAMTCPVTSESWVDYAQGGDPVDLAAQAACFSISGASTAAMGCGYEQHLAAGAKSMSANPGFFRDGRLLAVLVISDEDDCSISDSQIFETDEWSDFPGGLANLTCQLYPEYLTPLTQIKDALVSAKGGDENAVIFAAISGVPISPDCEGNGIDISACLDNPNMELVQETWTDSYGGEYIMWRPVCERSIGPEDETKATPATRFVELAELFGERGWVFSICNEDWTGVMQSLADGVLRTMQPGANDEETGLESSSSCSVFATGNSESLLEGILSLL